MIEAGDFARRPITSGGSNGFPFDMREPAQVAAELRRFADAVETGEVAILSIQSGNVVKPEEYLRHAIMFEFAQRQPERS